MKNNSLLLGGLFMVGVAILVIGVYSVMQPTQTNQTQPSKAVIPSKNSTPPKLVKEYSPGVGWTINPPSDMPCRELLTPPPSVTINNDRTEAKIVIPSNLDLGLAARNEQGREFILHTGEEFEITATGKVKFSDDHPCVDANGMNGWYDNHVDSPFNQNVGGLEFAIGNLMENRYFAGTHYQGKAEANGIFIGRVIETTKGYKDNNSGAFTVTVKKIK